MLSNGGVITIHCHLSDNVIQQVDCISTRPLSLPRKFIGQRQDSVLDFIPRIFSLCGISQAIASSRSADNQLCREILASHQAKQDFMLCLETIREHAFRLINFWPNIFDLPTARYPFNVLTKAIVECRHLLFKKSYAEPKAINRQGLKQLKTIVAQVEDLLRSLVYEMRIEAWYENTTEEFHEWLNKTNTLGANAISSLSAKAWQDDALNSLDEPFNITNFELIQSISSEASIEFSAAPISQGKPRENSAVTRAKHSVLTELYSQTGHNLKYRYCAVIFDIAKSFLRLMELAQIMQAKNTTETDGTGIGRVDSARGALIHYSKISDNMIQDYKIIAPTEWNFHPAGVLVKSIKKLTATKVSDLKQKINLFIHSLDPCVDFKVSYTNA